MFLHSEDVIQLIRKLHMLCDNSTQIYGPKRPLLDAQYPELCPLFDLFGESAVAEINIELGTLKFYESLGLDDTTLATFKQQLMSYASENLIKINAFLDSPYLSKFETDEVVLFVLDQISVDKNFNFNFLFLQVMSTTTLIANIGGMLGLCMGFSFVSLVEIFFFASKPLIDMIQGKK